MSSEMRDDILIHARSVRQVYAGTEVLHGVDLSVQANKLTVITGPSGSGKSTLLNIIAGIARPTDGEVHYISNGEKTDVTKLRNGKLDRFRSERAGFMPQNPNLLGSLSVRQNILMPAQLAKHDVEPDWFKYVSETLGIQSVLGQKAMDLSGGQQQRVSLARALVRKPDVILADEPSAPLDTEAKISLHQLLADKVIKELGSTVLMVSHDELSLEYADHIVSLKDGEIVIDGAANFNE